MLIRQCLRPGALASISSIMLTAAVGLTSMLGPAMGLGADALPMMDEKFPDLAASIKMLRAEVGQDRRDIVAAGMQLTKSEGEIFWPLYDKYRAEQHRLGDQKVELITAFPTIGEAGFIVGGAGGKGRVYERGKYVGDNDGTS